MCAHTNKHARAHSNTHIHTHTGTQLTNRFTLSIWLNFRSKTNLPLSFTGVRVVHSSSMTALIDTSSSSSSCHVSIPSHSCHLALLLLHFHFFYQSPISLHSSISPVMLNYMSWTEDYDGSSSISRHSRNPLPRNWIYAASCFLWCYLKEALMPHFDKYTERQKKLISSSEQHTL